MSVCRANGLIWQFILQGSVLPGVRKGQPMQALYHVTDFLRFSSHRRLLVFFTSSFFICCLHRNFVSLFSHFKNEIFPRQESSLPLQIITNMIVFSSILNLLKLTFGPRPPHTPFTLHRAIVHDIVVASDERGNMLLSRYHHPHHHQPGSEHASLLLY